MSCTRLFVLGLFVAGCAAEVQPVQPSHDGPRSPLVVAVEELSRDASGAELKLMVRKLNGRLAASVELVAPPGVLVSGFPGQELPADFVGEQVTVLRLSWPAAAGPASDLTVTARMEGQAQRATATATYRFGRAEQRPRPVAALPLRLQAGALRLEQAAPLEVVPPPIDGAAPVLKRRIERR